MFKNVKNAYQEYINNKLNTNRIVRNILTLYKNTREDNISVCIPTKLFNDIRHKLIDEYDLDIRWLEGNESNCYVEVAPYVNMHKIGRKIK